MSRRKTSLESEKVTGVASCPQELLEAIFEFFDQDSLVSCVTVNRLFFDVATKQLWFKIESPQRLFSILSPIFRSTQSEEYTFSRIPGLSDWKRFYIYSSKVRCLTINEKSWAASKIHQEVSRGRTRVSLLPKLTALHITLTPFFAENIALYVHKGLQELKVRVGTPENIALLPQFLTTVGERVEGLERFFLQGNIAITGIQKELSSFLRRQSNLGCVVLPLYTLNSLVLSSLSVLPRLFAIQIKFDDDGVDWGEGNLADILDLTPDLQANSFPKLMTLEFVATIKNTQCLFLSRHAPANITSMYFRTADQGTVESVMECFNTIADACSNLETLDVDMIGEVTGASILTTCGSIVFDSIRPLLKLKMLRWFTLYHPRVVLCNAEDLESLATSWPRIEGLYLNPDPLIPDQTLINLSSLEVFAKHCRSLKQLGLYLDARTLVHIPVAPEILENLEVLSLMASPVDDFEAVAIYLGQICPTLCKISNSLLWDDHVTNQANQDNFAVRTKNAEQWTNVKRLFPKVANIIKKYRDEVKVSRMAA